MDDALFAEALAFARNHPASSVDYSQAVVRVGRAEDLPDSGSRARLAEYLQAFAPWRKGPFEIFGQQIDANWRCDLKWERVAAFMEPLRGRRVCDVGTGNGYYLFRMAAHEPQSVLGLDPTQSFAQCFEFLNAFHETPALQFRQAGFDCLRETQYERAFDTIFCLGIVYHHTDPIDLLRILHTALRPGGQLIVESLGLPADFCQAPIALTPARGRYAGGGGNWFVPNALCLEQWLRRSGFRDVQLQGEYDFQKEQVRTNELPGLSEFLRGSETVEAYPVPVRIYASARR